MAKDKELSVKLTMNTRQAERALDRLANKLNYLNSRFKTITQPAQRFEREIKDANNRLNDTVQKTNKVRHGLEKLNGRALRIKLTLSQWGDAIKSFAQQLRNTNSAGRSLFSTIRNIAATYLSLQSLGSLLTTSDTITGARNRLNYANANIMGDSAHNSSGGYSEAVFTKTQEAMDKMYASSQKVRGSYTEMMSLVGKSMALAGEAFGNNTDNAIRFQEVMSEAYTIGGASADEISASMGQMIQALNSGQFAGDELRSVREGAPLAYKAIEKFVQKVWDTDESLKQLGADGKVSSEMVIQAILKEGKAIDTAFAKTEMQFSQIWEIIKNSATKAFKPVSEMLSEMLTKAVDAGLVTKIENFFHKVARVLMLTFTLIEKAVVWMANNWKTVQKVVLAVVSIIIGMLLLKAFVAITCAIIEIKAWLAANAAMLPMLITIALIIIMIVGLLYIFLLWKTGVIDTCTAIVYALLWVGAIAMIVGIIIGSVPLLIAGLVIAAIGLIIMFLDYFLAFVYSAGAFIVNLVIGVINAIIQLVWTALAEPFIGIVEWILNCCMGGFNSFGGAVANLIGQVISWFLSLGKVVTKIIDAIFGTDWTSGLNALQDKVLAWGKKDGESITISRDAPQINSRLSYSDSWNLGMKHGSAAQDWMANLGSGSQNWNLDALNKSSLFEGINQSNIPIGRDPSTGVGDSWKPLSDDELKNTIDGIGNDTGKIADSMELTEEDLKYLRDVANMEWKKEFTTATIQIDMKNNNTINGDADLEGIVTKLTDRLYEEMDAMANGVYAY